MGIYSFYRKILYIKNKSKNINLFYTKFIPNIERSLTQLKWIDKSTFLLKKIISYPFFEMHYQITYGRKRIDNPTICIQIRSNVLLYKCFIKFVLVFK